MEVLQQDQILAVKVRVIPKTGMLERDNVELGTTDDGSVLVVYLAR